MTNREREFASLGWDYCEGIEYVQTIIVPSTGRQIRRTASGWVCQPHNDNYWVAFSDLLEAAKFAVGYADSKTRE